MLKKKNPNTPTEKNLEKLLFNYLITNYHRFINNNKIKKNNKYLQIKMSVVNLKIHD